MRGKFVLSSIGSTLFRGMRLSWPGRARLRRRWSARPSRGLPDLCDVAMRRSLVRRSDDLLGMQLGDLVGAVAQLRQHLVCVFPEQRGAGDLGREARELDGAA